jgi:hypothetical protein
MTDQLRASIEKQAEEKYPLYSGIALDHISNKIVLGNRKCWITGATEFAENRKECALSFFDYMENERWKYDHREQKTHTLEEHWENFIKDFQP